MTITKLIYFLNKCWSKETCYPPMQKTWNNQNKAQGQCAITSLIVNDKLGGKIYKCEVNGISHYFNMVENEIIDLTKEQFENSSFEYINIREKKRTQVLADENTKYRYELLKSNLDQKMKKFNEINFKISKCRQCKSLVEKFENNDTIYLGKDTRILLLGEAPANNGWRKSKMLWKDINGKVLPSGAILQKLLNILEIDLFDLSFTEATKCFPIERKNLKKCSENCKEHLLEQLDLLEPTVVISLGDYATRSILNLNYKKFSDVVGKTYDININGKNITVLPIYHPSPISPKSYKGNIPIFENLKTILK